MVPSSLCFRRSRITVSVAKLWGRGGGKMIFNSFLSDSMHCHRGHVARLRELAIPFPKGAGTTSKLGGGGGASPEVSRY